MRGINQDTSSFRWFRNAIFGSKYSERDQKVNSTVVESREQKKICPDNRTSSLAHTNVVSHRRLQSRDASGNIENMVT